MICPSCDGEAHRVLYMGLPMNLCADDECATLWGFWSYAPVLFPVTPDGGFSFMAYQGSYLAALRHWLGGSSED